MSSPFQWPESFLTAEDLTLYNSVFSEAVKVHLPCKKVDLVPTGISEASSADLPEEWQDGLALVWKKGKPIVDHDVPRLFLPLWIDNSPYATAIINGGEETLYQRHSIKTLLEISRSICDDFLEIKINGTDPLTGLLNGVLFWRGLPRLSKWGEAATLVLLDVYPRHKDAAQGLSYIKRVAGSLRAMAGHLVPIYHLNSGIFAMFWRGVDTVKAGDMADVILHRFQLDGISRCHIGMIQADQHSSNGNAGIFDLAWSAVVKARQRGSLARFTYCSRAEYDNHPFPALPVKMANRFNSLCRGLETFAVAVLSPENADDLDVLEGELESLAGQEFLLVGTHRKTLLLLYKEQVGKECLETLGRLLKKVEQAAGFKVTAGVADFPCHDLKRADIPINARKALQHAFYLGAGNAVLLDAVSLNISGDVYYNEGDINSALREYHLGLIFDPENTNLLNSVGVAYARLGAIKKAVTCFEQALKIKDSDYMALYNLGSAWLAAERDDLASGYLAKAHESSPDNFDLVLQLAGVYCRTGEYAKVVELLEKQIGDPGHGRADWEMGAALRCLGEAWHELGEDPKAVACLQNASVYNPRDARVLSMLGEVYDLEGQGEDIALDLCRQALELDDSLWDNWYRLGVVKFRQGHYGSAIPDLLKSLKLNRRNVCAVRILVKIYDKMGKGRLAERMLEKERKMMSDKSYDQQRRC